MEAPSLKTWVVRTPHLFAVMTGYTAPHRVVASTVLSGFGWTTCWRETAKGPLRQRVHRSLVDAERHVAALAARRGVVLS